jgi:hypothetical protein
MQIKLAILMLLGLLCIQGVFEVEAFLVTRGTITLFLRILA